jgi:hypothetical protein
LSFHNFIATSSSILLILDHSGSFWMISFVAFVM